MSSKTRTRAAAGPAYQNHDQEAAKANTANATAATKIFSPFSTTPSSKAGIGSANTRFAFMSDADNGPKQAFSPFASTPARSNRPQPDSDTTNLRQLKPITRMNDAVQPTGLRRTISSQPFPSIESPPSRTSELRRTRSESDTPERPVITNIKLVSHTCFRPANEVDGGLKPRKIDHPYFKEAAQLRYDQLVARLTAQEIISQNLPRAIANLLSQRHIYPRTLTETSVRCAGCNQHIDIGLTLYDANGQEVKKPKPTKYNEDRWYRHRDACLGIDRLLLWGDHDLQGDRTPTIECRGCEQRVIVPRIVLPFPPRHLQRVPSQWQIHYQNCNLLQKLLGYEISREMPFQGSAFMECYYSCGAKILIDATDPDHVEDSAGVSWLYKHYLVCERRKIQLKCEEKLANRIRNPQYSTGFHPVQRARRLSDAGKERARRLSDVGKERIRRLSDAGKGKLKDFMGKI